MSLYASGTEVPADRSRAEIERILKRYGATGFVYGWEHTRALVGFQMHDRSVRFLLPMPKRSEHEQSPRGRWRSDNAIDQALEAEVRRRWRSLALAVKAKLDVVASGIVSFETEFLSYIVMPDGKTVADHVVPGVQAAYGGGKMRALLPSFE